MKAPDTIELFDTTVDDTEKLVDALLEYVNSKAGPTVAYNKAIEILKKVGCTDEK